MMRQFFIVLMVALLTLSLSTQEVFAKRFGGGRSFGVQRSTSSYSTMHNKKPSPAMQSNKPKSRWGGMLGGLLIGGLLASLFMHNGFIGGILSWLLIGFVLFFLFQLFRQRAMHTKVANPQADWKAPANHDNWQHFQSQAEQKWTSRPVQVNGFDEASFLREAKNSFSRLQEAYDQKNFAVLEECATPEVLSEIKLQLQERVEASNRTEFINLQAQVLDLSLESQMVTVLFSGLVKENDNHPAPFEEIWHFRREASGQNWLLCGIQQDSDSASH